MNTPYSEVYELFLDRIIKDDTFIIKDTSNEEESNRLTELKLLKTLNQAIYEIMLVNSKKNFEVNFNDKDDILLEFLFELNLIEKNLLADYMFLCHVGTDYVLRWKALKEEHHFTDNEIKLVMHSPANSLKEFTSSVNTLKSEIEKKVRIYLNRDRVSNNYKSFDYNRGD